MAKHPVKPGVVVLLPPKEQPNRLPAAAIHLPLPRNRWRS
jgi:hypothetical protein